MGYLFGFGNLVFPDGVHYELRVPKKALMRFVGENDGSPMTVAAVMAKARYCAEPNNNLPLRKNITTRDEQLYGEEWDAAPDIEDIPKLYQEVLNEYYAVVRDRWPADQLMDLGAIGMADYYGEASLDNIGFALVDLNGDRVDELVIGAVAQAERQGNEIFCIYTDPENPAYTINYVEGWVYYLHAGEADGTYEAEIVGLDSVLVIETAKSENTFDFNIKEGVMDPAGRLTLAMTPFSRYK